MIPSCTERDQATRRAVEMLALTLTTDRQQTDPETAFTTAGFDLAHPVDLVGFTAARLAADLLQHAQAEALAHHINLVDPLQLLDWYTDLLNEQDPT